MSHKWAAGGSLRTFCPKFCRGLSRPAEIFSSCLSLFLSPNEESFCLDSSPLGKNRGTAWLLVSGCDTHSTRKQRIDQAEGWADIVACSRQAWADIVSPSFYADVELLLVSVMEHYSNGLPVALRQYPNFTDSHLTNGSYFLRIFDSDFRIWAG